MPEVANLSTVKRSSPEYDAKAARADDVVCEFEGIARNPPVMGHFVQMPHVSGPSGRLLSPMTHWSS
jgi:hypothetical protein